MRRDTPSNAVGAHLGATCDRSRPSALLRPAIGRARVRSYQGSCMSRIQRILARGLFTLVLLVLSGWLLADHLTPRAFGVPSHALPLQAAQTELDRETVPLVERRSEEGRVGKEWGGRCRN